MSPPPAPDVVDMAQLEKKRRKNTPGYTGKNIFAAKIICGDCGAFYGAAKSRIDEIADLRSDKKLRSR